jgi:integrase/recombinase XerD
MSQVALIAEDYLRVRRALGYKLERQGWQLGQFVAYLDRVGASTVTIEHAVAWATEPTSAGARYWSDRLSVVRQFARHLRTIDPTCVVPPKELLPYRKRRPTPFIYTREEIDALMRATGGLRGELHRATMRTLIGLMAATGMRVGETIGLNRGDVDDRHQLLRIIDSKFGKSREVALHTSTIDALHAYAGVRDHCCPQPGCEAFFLSRNGTRLLSQVVHLTFSRLVQTAGLQPRSTGCRPRMHGLRHTFAVSTLLDWYANGENVQAKLPLLSTFLGHVEPATTYYYLTAVPELLTLAAQRLEPVEGDR